MLEWVTENNQNFWLEEASGILPELPNVEFSNDKDLIQYMLENGITQARIPVKKTLDDFLVYYGQNKEHLD